MMCKELEVSFRYNQWKASLRFQTIAQQQNLLYHRYSSINLLTPVYCSCHIYPYFYTKYMCLKYWNLIAFKYIFHKKLNEDQAWNKFNVPSCTKSHYGSYDFIHNYWFRQQLAYNIRTQKLYAFEIIPVFHLWNISVAPVTNYVQTIWRWLYLKTSYLRQNDAEAMHGYHATFGWDRNSSIHTWFRNRSLLSIFDLVQNCSSCPLANGGVVNISMPFWSVNPVNSLSLWSIVSTLGLGISVEYLDDFWLVMNAEKSQSLSMDFKL